MRDDKKQKFRLVDKHCSRRVVRWRWDGSSLSADGFYAAGELDAVRSVDGDGRVSLVFTDCMGRTVLQRALTDSVDEADGAFGSNPSYTGRISAKSTQNDNSKISVYNYSYDQLGRLISADFKQPSVNNPGAYTLADYSTSYTYDLQGNILTLNRKGPKASQLYGVIDNITATYQGNQIASLRDDAANVLLESSLDLPHGEWSGSDFEYDRNGNQTRDLSRGVADIEYNALNLPARIEMASGGPSIPLYNQLNQAGISIVYHF